MATHPIQPPPQADFNKISNALNVLATEIAHMPNTVPLTEDQFRNILRGELVTFGEKLKQDIRDDLAALKNELKQEIGDDLAALKNELKWEIAALHKEVQTTNEQVTLVPMKIHNYTCGLAVNIRYPPGIDVTGLPQTKTDLLSASSQELISVATALELPSPREGTVPQQRERILQHLGI